MSTAKPQQQPQPQQEQLPAISRPRLPYHPLIEERYGIDKSSWKALVESVFPTASSVDSVVLALSYCRARKLDVFKRVVHIVPIWDKHRGCMVDTIWPGIGELRTTAFRTGEYAGRKGTEFGPDITQKVGKIELTFPEWAQVTVCRMIRGTVVEFAGPRVYWLETYATAARNDETPNEMWRTRVRGQIDKCAEAAALRAAFPEEIGSEYIPEEVHHNSSVVYAEATKKPSLSERLSAQLPPPPGNWEEQEYVAPAASNSDVISETSAVEITRQGAIELAQRHAEPVSESLAEQLSKQLQAATTLAQIDVVHRQVLAYFESEHLTIPERDSLLEQVLAMEQQVQSEEQQTSKKRKAGKSLINDE